MFLKAVFMVQADNHSYDFGRFRLKTSERVLLREGELVPLTPKVFDILITLVENRGQVVEKDDLMKRVWPTTFVEEGNLTQNVSLLRKALGESTSGVQFIETVPRRGYRFVAEISESWDDQTGALVKPAALTADNGQHVATVANGVNPEVTVTEAPSPVVVASKRPTFRKTSPKFMLSVAAVVIVLVGVV